jgi:hypothetical protein
MRVFSKGRLARAIAHLLTLTFVGFAWLTGVGTGPAAAQIVTRAATTQTVAVVPFENLSGIRPDVLGEDASEAVSVELLERLLLDVLPKADVTLQMRSLDLAAPLSDVELVRLAAELEVALLITGQVRAARLMRTPQGRSAEVVLAVRLFDRVARADVNGALVSAQSPPSPDASDEVLLRKALAQAAFEAVEEMKSRPTITAMVLWSRGDTIFLNVGTRGGVRPGMQMVAIRSGERISLVKVTDADATGAYAEVVGGAALRTGDHLRAVYELPREAGERPAQVIEKTSKRFEKVVLAAAVLFGLGSHASRARLLQEGGIAAPDFVTSNLANMTELGMGGYYPSLIAPGRLTPIGATLTTWKAYSGTQKERLFLYEIYRNDELLPPQYVPWLLDDKVIDGAMAPMWIYLTYSIDPVTGELEEITTELEVYTPEFDDETGEWDPQSWDDFVDSHTDQIGIIFEAGGTSISYGMMWGPDFTGPTTGQYYTYRVTPVVLKQIQVSGGTYEWWLFREVDMSSSLNSVVVVSAPGAYPFTYTFTGYQAGVYEIWDVTANPVVAGNLATFGFYSPLGADEMIIQVARDPNVFFDPAVGIHEQTVPVTYTGYMADIDVQVDLTQVPGTGGVFWWRIGARNRRSATPPRPWPAHLTNDYGWVWSNRLGFTLSTLSRASLLHEEREAVARSEMRAVRTRPRTTTSRIHRAE